MPYSSGTFSLLYDFVTEAAAAPIEIAKLKEEFDGIATALSTCLLRDGTGIPTATTPWNSQRLSNLGNATAAADAVNASQIQSGALLKLGSVAGTVDVITAALTPALGAYAAGQMVVFTPSGTNTTNVTININSLGAKAIVKHNNVALSAGDLKAAVPAVCQYDGTSFVLLNPLLAHTANADAAEVGFKGIPQNAQTSNYTCVLSDAGKHVYGTSSCGTVTIPANSSVAYPVGTVLTFVNNTDANMTIAITSDTLILAGTTSTGSRTLADNSVATALKVTTTAWYIQGVGLS